MYKIYADNTLIYDSTLEDYIIGKGQVTLETNKSGSFVFSIYPDHFYYDKFVRLKTIITVYKSDKIVFRGRILKDVTDYWNNKVITCEGELGFLNDSIIRPFSFSGTPGDLIRKLINEHNSQVGNDKKFNVGVIESDVSSVAHANVDYETCNDNLMENVIKDLLGGYVYITHENNQMTPTINYTSNISKVASQRIEFGSNLKSYTKTVNAEKILTAIIPLGAEIDDIPVTISSVNNGVDYVYNSEAINKYGWIFKVEKFDKIEDPSLLKAKAEEYLENLINQNITIELKAIDLHLLDSSIESFNLNDYIHVISIPHNFDSTLLCKKITLDLLKPENDTYILGYTYSTFTESNKKVNNVISKVSVLASSVNSAVGQVVSMSSSVSNVTNNVVNIESRLAEEKDYILDQGIKKGWSYRQWYSGLYECWINKSETINHYTTYDSFYGYQLPIEFPITLAEKPRVFFNSTINTGLCVPGGCVDLTTSSANLRALSSVSGSVATEWDIYVMGKWK